MGRVHGVPPRGRGSRVSLTGETRISGVGVISRTDVVKEHILVCLCSGLVEQSTGRLSIQTLPGTLGRDPKVLYDDDQTSGLV